MNRVSRIGRVVQFMLAVGAIIVAASGSEAQMAPSPVASSNATLSAVSGFNVASLQNVAMKSNPINTAATLSSPLQSLSIQRKSDYSVSFAWRNSVNAAGASSIKSVQVTLLNRYHLPVASQTAQNGNPVVFAPNTNTYAGRYYRVSVVYSDGAVAAAQGTIK